MAIQWYGRYIYPCTSRRVQCGRGHITGFWIFATGPPRGSCTLPEGPPLVISPLPSGRNAAHTSPESAGVQRAQERWNMAQPPQQLLYGCRYYYFYPEATTPQASRDNVKSAGIGTKCMRVVSQFACRRDLGVTQLHRPRVTLTSSRHRDSCRDFLAYRQTGNVRVHSRPAQASSHP